MILEILSVGLLISACLAIFLDEAVYSVGALAGTFFITALLYLVNGAVYVAIFQVVAGVGSIAILFLSGEMLTEKPEKKTSPKKALGLVAVGAVLSLPAILLSVSGSTGVVVSDISFSDALWNLRGLDVVFLGLVVLVLALGISIILYEKRNGGK
jgi:NADH:ubiquinone oxidoreductase subunit 6 (subunit J)